MIACLCVSELRKIAWNRAFLAEATLEVSRVQLNACGCNTTRLLQATIKENCCDSKYR